MEKHGKLSQNDVDEADTAVVCEIRRLAIWIFGEIAKKRQICSPDFPLNGAIFLVTQFIREPLG